METTDTYKNQHAVLFAYISNKHISMQNEPFSSSLKEMTQVLKKSLLSIYMIVFPVVCIYVTVGESFHYSAKGVVLDGLKGNVFKCGTQGVIYR